MLEYVNINFTMTLRSWKICVFWFECNLDLWKKPRKNRCHFSNVIFEMKRIFVQSCIPIWMKRGLSLMVENSNHRIIYSFSQGKIFSNHSFVIMWIECWVLLYSNYVSNSTLMDRNFLRIDYHRCIFMRFKYWRCM